MRLGMGGMLRVCLLMVCAAETVRAQIVIQYSGLPRYEAGFQFNALALNGPVNAGDLGGGFHFGYNYNPFFSVEAEVSAHNLSSNRATLLGLVGPRVGHTSRDVGLYVKLLPGFIRFPSHDPDLIPPVAQHPAHFAFATGMVLMRYYERHLYVRFDIGRTFVDYGGGSYVDPITKKVTHLGVPGGFSGSFGVGAHW
ncbi:MAG TPA: hypothetical protein VKB48_06515 [Candidatus Acidoferrum sp.]|nr:hypothetical protein [Candidatus Acidoferrum sp.]